jgi:hypothetical protein
MIDADPELYQKNRDLTNHSDAPELASGRFYSEAHLSGKMDALEELNSHLTGGPRVIVIAQKDVDLRPSGGNQLFLLKIAEGSLAAGGRGGGFGERRVVSVICFNSQEGHWAKLYETQDESRAADFEVPYHVSRLPLTLADGSETMGYGVVEPELVQQMATKAGVPFSP